MMKELCIAAGFVVASSGAALAQATIAQPVVPGYQASGTGGLIFMPSVPSKSALNITSATVVKTGPGVVGTVCVDTAGSTTSTIIDSTGTTVTAANTILAMGNGTAGACTVLNFPAQTGIAVVPGTSAVLSLSYQ